MLLHKEQPDYILAINSLTQQIRDEMPGLCSLLRPSILRDSQGAVKNFNWQALVSEFSSRIPTLVLVLKKVLPKANDKFIAFIIAMILKKRCKDMFLVQKVVSVLLYGNGTSKQVLA